MEHFLAIKKSADERLAKYQCLAEAEQKVGVEKFYIALAGGFLTLGLLYLLGGGVLIVNLVGFAYPAYMSFKALATPQPDDDTQWLTYWVVFAFFSLTEQCTSLFMSWIPFYLYLKLGFFVWCFFPTTLVSLSQVLEITRT